jgi:stage III sporulation protein AA
MRRTPAMMPMTRNGSWRKWCVRRKSKERVQELDRHEDGEEAAQHPHDHRHAFRVEEDGDEATKHPQRDGREEQGEEHVEALLDEQEAVEEPAAIGMHGRLGGDGRAAFGLRIHGRLPCGTVGSAPSTPSPPGSCPAARTNRSYAGVAHIVLLLGGASVGDPLGDILTVLPGPLAGCLGRLPAEVAEAVEEVRLGRGRPLLLVTADGDGFVSAEGRFPVAAHEALRVEGELFEELVGRLTRWSVYALEEELRMGFLTLPGGHRVGLAGRGVVEEGHLRTLRDLSAVSIRCTREVPGAARFLLPHLLDGPHPLPTLLVSPPRSGKTTLLRDLVRQLSWGRPDLDLVGRRVVVVDERSEIAGMAGGSPQRDVGPRTDVLDGVPKAVGMTMAIRALGPEVLVTDEVGREADTEALVEATRSGVVVLASAHGSAWRDLEARPSTALLFRERVFRRIVLLSRRFGPGTVEAVLDGDGRTLVGRPFRASGEAPR